MSYYPLNIMEFTFFTRIKRKVSKNCFIKLTINKVEEAVAKFDILITNNCTG